MTPAKGADQETAPRFSVRLAVVVLALSSSILELVILQLRQLI